MASTIRMRTVELRKPTKITRKHLLACGSPSTTSKSMEEKRAARLVANEKLAKLAKKPKANTTILEPTVETVPTKPKRGRPVGSGKQSELLRETHEEVSGTDEEIEEEEKAICKKSSKKRKEIEEECSVDVESISSPSRSPSPGIVQSISTRNSGLIQVPLGPRQSFSWFEVVGLTLHRLGETTGRIYFHHKHEICKYMDDHWDEVCLGHERTSTWWKTVLATITTRREFFVSEGRGSGHWKLDDTHANIFKTLWDSHMSGKNAGVVLEVACSSAPSKTYQSRRALARSLSDDDSNKKRKRATHISPLHKRRRVKSPDLEESVDSPRSTLRRHSYPTNDNLDACHHCEQQSSHVAICTQCPLKYCTSCLSEYSETVEKAIKQTDWKCPKCRLVCQCESCSQDVEGDEEEEIEEHATKIMASRIGKEGERQYCVRWYDKSIHSFSTTWETNDTLLQRSHELSRSDSQQLQGQMKNILNYDLQFFYRSITTSTSQKKSRPDKLRSADFDIGRMVSPTTLPCRLPQQPIQEINISTPSWREVIDNPKEEDLEVELDSDSEDEDESDEIFTSRHARAAIEMKKQIDRVIATSSTTSSMSMSSSSSSTSSLPYSSTLLTQSAPSVAVLSPQRLARLRVSK